MRSILLIVFLITTQAQASDLRIPSGMVLCPSLNAALHFFESASVAFSAGIWLPCNQVASDSVQRHCHLGR